MPTHDIQNRPYARLSQLKPGDIVIVDDGFTCMTAWSEKEIRTGDCGLYIECEKGIHTIDGQLDIDGAALIGIYRKEDFQ